MDILPLRVLDHGSDEFKTRLKRWQELRESVSIHIPPPVYEIRSLVELLINTPFVNPEESEIMTLHADSFFGKPSNIKSHEIYSSCMYKQVSAALLAIHRDPLYPDTRALAFVTRYSGLHEDSFDRKKFNDSIREGWIQEAAELAIKDLDEPAVLGVDDLSQAIRLAIREGFVRDPRAVDELGYNEMITGINCLTISRVVQKLTGLTDFKYCPIGKVGSAPKRDRWQHCPSICAERGVLVEWHRWMREKLIEEPFWYPVTQKILLTTALPCHYCAMGLAQEPAMAFIYIGSLQQRPGQPYLNIDDEIALDTLIQSCYPRRIRVMLYNKESGREYLEYLNQIGR